MKATIKESLNEVSHLISNSAEYEKYVKKGFEEVLLMVKGKGENTNDPEEKVKWKMI